MLSYTFTLSQEDITRFNINVLTKTKSGKALLVLIRLLLPLVTFFVLLFKILNVTTGFFVLFFCLGTLIPNILWIIFSGKIFKAIIRASIKNKTDAGEYTFPTSGRMTVDSYGVAEEHEGGSTKRAWSEILGVWVFRNGDVYVFFNENAAFIFAGSIFETPEEKDRLVAKLADNVAQERFSFFRK